MRYFRFVFVVALAVFIISSPMVFVSVRAMSSIFYVPILSNAVTLDGVINGDEWADANRMNVTFERDGLTYNGTIFLKHDHVDLLMCIQVEDEDEEPSPSPGVFGDMVGVIFDANGNGTTDAGDDMAILSHDDQPMDRAYTSAPPTPPEEDETLGGVMNVQGFSEWAAGVYTFELSKPLNSSDSAGNDIALSPGDQILAMFIYVDPDIAGEAPPFTGFSLFLAPYPINIGVKAGDWAGYGDISFESASNMPEYEPQETNMSWMSMEILDVQNTNVTILSTVIYENGTEEIVVDWGDIATGEGNLSVGIIPSDLTSGDMIPASLTWYTEEPLKFSINGTVTRKYAGADREVNYVNITYPITYDNMTFGSWNMSFYWDKETGFLCEEIVTMAMSYMVNTTQYYMNMSIFSRMTATNMWPAVFTVQDGYTFIVTMMSNSTISDFNFNEAQKQISFDATGPAGKMGYCNVTIPKDLLRDSPWTILLNGTDWTSSCTITENATHSFIYLPYTHSTNTIQIVGTWVVPEFPPAITLSLFTIIALVAVALTKNQNKAKTRTA